MLNVACPPPSTNIPLRPIQTLYPTHSDNQPGPVGSPPFQLMMGKDIKELISRQFGEVNPWWLRTERAIPGWIVGYIQPSGAKRDVEVEGCCNTNCIKPPKYCAQGNGWTASFGGCSSHDIAVDHGCHTSWKSKFTAPLGQPQNNCFFKDIDMGLLPESPGSVNTPVSWNGQVVYTNAFQSFWVWARLLSYSNLLGPDPTFKVQSDGFC